MSDPTPKSSTVPPEVPADIPSRDVLTQVARADRLAIRRLFDKIEKARKADKPFDKMAERLRTLVEASVTARAARLASRPVTSYPAELPITEHRDEIAAALREHQVVVVAGETGSGKSTQLPKILLDLGYGVDGLIGHTQPRRIAARSLAARLSEELGGEAGVVAHKIRFDDATGPNTAVKFMTDGVLLAETAHDRTLSAYEAIIVDEAHERSLNIDFLLGTLKRLLPKRRDLRVVITSATIDTERFAEHFSHDGKPAPVIEVSGRTYPVELSYRPIEPDEDEEEPDLVSGVVAAVQQALGERDGDVLVFLPTQRDISEVTKVLSGRKLGEPVEILPLFARLAADKQRAIFKPGDQRRVVLATNVAESSVTVPRISMVIDTGLARISRYSARSRLQRLPIEPISQASANQRKGRCGRIGPGHCIRLFDEDDFESREAFTQPEIQRSNLASVILQMMALGLGRIDDFPFLDPPKRGMVKEGLKTLTELGAIDAEEHITPLGRRLARFPVDPRIARMIVAAEEERCVTEMLIIAAALEVQDPRDRPPGKEAEADAAHAKLSDPESDVMGWLKLWDHYESLREGRNRRKLAKECRAQFLNPNRCREWSDVHRQLRELAQREKLHIGKRRDDRSAVHRALLAGLLSNIAQRDGKYEYIGADGKVLYLWPGSVLFERKPRWIVATEIIETTRRYARNAAAIDPRVVEPLAKHLCERTYRDAAWDRRSGHVLAMERVTLYGLPIIPRRRTNYDDVDPLACRELFLRHALTDGELDTGAGFLAHNAALVIEVAAMEAKTRRRDLLVDLDARYDFYEQRVPAHVTSGPSFNKWRKQAERENPELLYMSLEDLVSGVTEELPKDEFPDTLDIDGRSYPLVYRLDPGSDRDGVAVQVPLTELEDLPAERLEWLVPGLLRDKIVALIRALPKVIRRSLVPAPARAEHVARRIVFARGSLIDEVAPLFQRLAGAPITRKTFDLESIPTQLVMLVEVVDERGEVVASGRDVDALRASLGRRARRVVDELADDSWKRDGITSWDVGDLPEHVQLMRNGRPLLAYPALVDRGGMVSLRLRGRRDVADAETRRAVHRLLVLAHRGRILHRLHKAKGWRTMALNHATLGDTVDLEAQIVERVIDRAFLEGAPDIRTDEAFRALSEAGRHRAPIVTEEVALRCAAILAAHQRARLTIDEALAKPWKAVAAAANQHLAILMSGRLFSESPWAWFTHVPRYLDAVVRRFERIAIRGTAKDRIIAERFAVHWNPFLMTWVDPTKRRAGGAPLETMRWLLEEARVSAFAQELGTALKVSDKRLSEQWELVQTELSKRLPPPE